MGVRCGLLFVEVVVVVVQISPGTAGGASGAVGDALGLALFDGALWLLALRLSPARADLFPGGVFFETWPARGRATEVGATAIEGWPTSRAARTGARAARGATGARAAGGPPTAIGVARWTRATRAEGATPDARGATCARGVVEAAGWGSVPTARAFRTAAEAASGIARPRWTRGTATGPGRPFLGEVDSDASAIDGGARHLLAGGLGVVWVREAHEAEPAASTGLAVGDHAHVVERTETLECGSQRSIAGLWTESTDEELGRHDD